MNKLLCTLFLFCLVTKSSFSQISERENETGKTIVFETKFTKMGSDFTFSSPNLILLKMNDGKGQLITVITISNDKYRPLFNIHSGWGLFGDCWVYGTFITDNSGNTLFDPCGFSCIGFPAVCAEDGNGICRFVFRT
jgi:hypothetical protein